ncbi:hypothetical protein ACFORO_08685 [Amycolatopsis halotolerans]|uniref:Uncharacterized protein n=1 Tax=Amycolatopsis halotolerans TaxID=330083 RepID=A0ABV7QEC9_9PSEU
MAVPDGQLPTRRIAGGGRPQTAKPAADLVLTQRGVRRSAGPVVPAADHYEADGKRSLAYGICGVMGAVGAIPICDRVGTMLLAVRFIPEKERDGLEHEAPFPRRWW